ncbi:GNAT family N-acetyltransferase [Leifsonia sp. L25]|uniref:GNAT family N-acetyltransferase n=1 Tax=Actinomycetes TaxID=1760 RepID=UPI003D6803A8
MSTEFSNETDANRYAMRIDGELVGILDYSVLGSSISLTRAFTVPAQRGHGYAADLVAYAVDDIESTSGRRIVPMCWYVAEWFDRHPERAGLLQRRAG